MRDDARQEFLGRVSPNALVVIVAVAITLMQLGSAFWVKQTTSAQRAIDIQEAIRAHMKDPNPHSSDMGKSLDANQRAVMQRLAIVEALLVEHHQRMDRIQASVNK